MENIDCQSLGLLCDIKAISQSGVALCPWAVNRNPQQYAEEIARKVGCPTDSGMVACLRSTDPKTVTLAGTVSFIISSGSALAIDGDFIPDEPETLYGNAADIDYIAGVNDMDGHIFATLDIPSINNALESTPVDPNKGESIVPVTWPEFASNHHQYVEINNNMNKNSVKQMLRTHLVYYWTTVFASFPGVQKN
ncbi:bile salt-activated lipase-like [Carassius carassius]|uniref:bile salt-activated lipase-like n=1 Tax=Carassius carassius TaxID=217509 RepID=UPI00286954C2|nr:bile salt-activated lipase-like [Carassius carassius]